MRTLIVAVAIVVLLALAATAGWWIGVARAPEGTPAPAPSDAAPAGPAPGTSSAPVTPGPAATAPRPPAAPHARAQPSRRTRSVVQRALSGVDAPEPPAIREVTDPSELGGTVWMADGKTILFGEDGQILVDNEPGGTWTADGGALSVASGQPEGAGFLEGAGFEAGAVTLAGKPASQIR